MLRNGNYFLWSGVFRIGDFIDKFGWCESYIMIIIILKCDDNDNYNSNS